MAVFWGVKTDLIPSFSSLVLCRRIPTFDEFNDELSVRDAHKSRRWSTKGKVKVKDEVEVEIGRRFPIWDETHRRFFDYRLFQNITEYVIVETGLLFSGLTRHTCKSIANGYQYKKKGKKKKKKKHQTRMDANTQVAVNQPAVFPRHLYRPPG